MGLGVRHYLRYSRPNWSPGRWSRQLGLACLVLLVGALVWRGRGPYLDLTADQLNTPSPLLGRLLQGTSLSAELIATHRASMPRQLKDAEDRIRTLLADCNIPLRVIRPDALTPDQQQTLAAEGLTPFPVERVLHDTLATQYVWSGLRLIDNVHTVTVPRLDQRAHCATSNSSWPRPLTACNRDARCAWPSSPTCRASRRPKLLKTTRRRASSPRAAPTCTAT